jgi:hypothetical protein
MDDFVPVVDLDADPLLNLDACREILLGEGYYPHQVEVWTQTAQVLSPRSLSRRN